MTRFMFAGVFSSFAAASIFEPQVNERAAEHLAFGRARPRKARPWTVRLSARQDVALQ